MFSKFFINRPIFATVISLVIVLAGLVSMQALPVEQYPDIVPTEIQISATYPGATARGFGRYGRRTDRAGSQRRQEHDLHVLKRHLQRLSDHRRRF